MVKYSSRINPRKRKPIVKTDQPKPKMSTTGDELSEVKVFDSPTQSGGALSTAGSLASGGALPLVKEKSLIQKVAPVIKKIVPAVKKIKASIEAQKTAGSLSSGGSLRTGGKLVPESMLGPEDVDKMTWMDMIHTLGSMDMPTYHILQGLASAHLNLSHPMSSIIKSSIGGSFIHPKQISRIATKDILKAPTPQKLSQALHNEWMDMMQGKDVGGGLFSSLKMLAKKGVSGAKKALGSVAKGAKQAVGLLSSGAKASQMIGKKLSNAINQGIEVANVLGPAVSGLSPAAAELISRGTDIASNLQQSISKGVDIAQQVQMGLDPILGNINAPLIDLP